MEKGTVMLFGGATLGEGDDALGALLMRSFVKTLGNSEVLPTHMMFVNGGVKLTTTGSPLIEDLRALAERGVAVLSCGTCLDFFDLKDKLEVGEPTTMGDTVQNLLASSKVVRV